VNSYSGQLLISERQQVALTRHDDLLHSDLAVDALAQVVTTCTIKNVSWHSWYLCGKGNSWNDHAVFDVVHKSA